ncbi:hypothetical protein AYM40_37485 (plasmid) [Paraburkholderia phytofirmans OLGA172]|uniref:Uncharacterized protein n=2 Tax=Paraburkholderia phytofirmans TaxID=261302 RepID=A0A167WQZ0_9BURK|nr:hypothetical protein AYM40_37485 [Paraburkholderia phytofirmans OLGA172]
MRNLADRFLGLALSCMLFDVPLANPMVVAQKRAARGMFLSLASSAALSGLAVVTAPKAATSGGLVPVAAMQLRVTAGLGWAAFAAAAVGMCFIVRYALVVIWPDRFVKILHSQ